MRIAVVGAGTMRSGIALPARQAGLRVVFRGSGAGLMVDTAVRLGLNWPQGLFE